jgi:hypothetical protein
VKQRETDGKTYGITNKERKYNKKLGEKQNNWNKKDKEGDEGRWRAA